MPDILQVIRERQSFRGPFDPQRPVSGADLEQILEAARWAPTPHNMQNYEIVVVDDKAMLAAVGAVRSAPSAVFLQENFLQMSFSEEELRHRKTGVLAATFPAAWRVPNPKPEDIASVPHATLGDALQGSPMLLIVAYNARKRAPASEGDVLGTMSLGCVMENMWLAATACGLGMQILSSATGQAVAAEVSLLVGLPDHLKIGFASRLGYPLEGANAHLHVRRDVQEIVHYNRYCETINDRRG